LIVLNTDFDQAQLKLQEFHTNARKIGESQSSLPAKFTFVPVARNNTYYQNNGIQSEKNKKKILVLCNNAAPIQGRSWGWGKFCELSWTAKSAKKKQFKQKILCT